MNDKAIIIFDGLCNLCTGFVQFLHRRDKNRILSFIPSQSPQGSSLLETHQLCRDTVETVVLIEEHAIYLRSDAALRILRKLPFPWNMWSALRFFPRPLRDFVYQIVAINRYRWFGKRDKCFVLPSIFTQRNQPSK